MKSIPDRVRALISVAHPDFREDLEKQAYEAGLLMPAAMPGNF
jgi:acyl-CoA hydrolase